MPTLFFGTYDELTHPRVRVLREGLVAHGHHVEVANAPLDFGTARRVQIASRPWTAPLFAIRVLRRWVSLWRATRGLHPDVVVVGYMGQFDVHLARRRFPRAIVVLDHMVGLGDTVRDRQLSRSWLGRALDRVDRAATAAADVVLVDTGEHASTLPPEAQPKALVVPVGAPASWFHDAPPGTAAADPVRFVFYGLFTPLQGAPVIGEALRLIPDVPLLCTMVGTGQDLAATRDAVGDDARVTWIPWIEPDELAPLVAGHDVCLGIFGDSEKARRVVPNKVYQGAAAGCALVTSDTPPQRRLLADRAVLVPPGDAASLGAALSRLAGDPSLVTELRARSRALAEQVASPAAVVRPLLDRLPRT